jgi:hypothetical protein
MWYRRCSAEPGCPDHIVQRICGTCVAPGIQLVLILLLGAGSSRRFVARIGPGLWPGPRRQARRVGRGSRVNGAPQARPRAARMRSTVDAGGADPDNARRSGPVPVTFRPATGAPGANAAAWSSSCSAIPRQLRREPVAAGAGQPCAAAARARRAAARKGASESCRPQRREPGYLSR